MLRAKVPESIVALANTPLKKDLHLDEHGRPIVGFVNTKLTRNHNQTKSSLTLRKGIKHPQMLYPLRGDPKGELSSRFSYLAMEKKKHISEGTAKVNWQSLEKMKANDLKGFLTEDFEPTDLIGYEEPEDKEYLSAFNLDPERKHAEDRKFRRNHELMNYGRVKRSLPPLESKRSIHVSDPYRAPPADPLPSLSRIRPTDKKSPGSQNRFLQ